MPTDLKVVGLKVFEDTDHLPGCLQTKSERVMLGGCICNKKKVYFEVERSQFSIFEIVFAILLCSLCFDCDFIGEI